jgi:signal transduction histidine kinase/DNA-binding response OmpR family regulator
VDFAPIGPWNTDALLVANPLHTQARSEYIQGLIAGGLPVLFIGAGERGPTIMADNMNGIQEALRHLTAHGHRQIAFIAGSQSDLSGDSGERLFAYRSFLEVNDLEFDQRRIAYGRHVYDGGYAAMLEILNSGAHSTAVLASNDESALGAMQALEEAGRKIPGDVAVIGFDNRFEGAAHEPGLSSVHVPLFDMGYRALKHLYEHLQGKELAQAIKVNTRLVTRASCGCGDVTASSTPEIGTEAQLVTAMSASVMSHAHSLAEEECRRLCQTLADGFAVSVKERDGKKFQTALQDVVKRTAVGEEDASVWQEAVALLGVASQARPASTVIVQELMKEAQVLLSRQMQNQHRNYVLRERWTSSRMSLLTDRLLDALDETQIYEILAAHLPDLGIDTAMLALLEADEADPAAWSNIHNIFEPREFLRIPSREFPPHAWTDSGKPFRLTLIPLVAHSDSGQLGFMAFGAEHLDLYGAIVQQLGGAFNTARLYRQAVQDRQVAEEANRMKSRFLSTISHELRTPLNLIVGLSSFLLQEGEGENSQIPESTQKDIKRIHAYAQHLGGLIGDVIDLATLDAGRFRLNKELIDLGDALQMVAESGSQMATDKNLIWRAEIPDTGPWVLGDRTRLRQVILNLVNNAIKFTQQGEIRLSLTSDGNLVTVLVRDTGLGIPPEEQNVIFDAFRRSERSIAMGYPGLGLGLAICKMLIEMHGGTMGLRSTGVEGEGAEFYLTLPVQAPPQREPARSGENQRMQQSVLVLSSEPGSNERLCTLLKQRGMRVREVLTGIHADWQAKLDGDIPDVIVLDVTTQSSLNWATLKTIKENPATRGVPTFLYASSEDGESLMSLDYLTKPVELDEVTRALDQHWSLVDPVRQTRTILVVDDEPNTLDLHARIVQSQSTSNRVLLAGSGIQALKILGQEKIDLILLDLQMPEMDGFSVLEAIRENENTSEIPVIVVTGKVLTEEDMNRLNQGVAVVLQKGLFNVDETVAHIKDAIERRRNLGTDTQRLIRQAMVYIHKHYSEAVSRQDIAQHINISEDYLTFCFRQEMGTTPIRYLQRYRVKQAKRLLKDSSKTITEISMDVGFSDSGYFSRIFHRETGMSPEQFRRS